MHPRRQNNVQGIDREIGRVAEEWRTQRNVGPWSETVWTCHDEKSLRSPLCGLFGYEDNTSAGNCVSLSVSMIVVFKFCIPYNFMLPNVMHTLY